MPEELIQRPPLTPENLGAAHIINLATRRDRWTELVDHVRQHLQWDLTLIRHEAVDTRKWQHTHTTRERDKSFLPYVDSTALGPIIRGTRGTWRDLTAGAVGCSLSHIALYSLLGAHEDWSHMLILEDDAEWNKQLPPMAYPAFLDALNRLPADWDILVLGGKPMKTYSQSPSHLHLKFFWQTHAYILRKQAAWKLWFGAYPIKQPIDYHISSKAAELRIYMPTQHYFVQRHSDDPTQREADSDVNIGPPTRGTLF